VGDDGDIRIVKALPRWVSRVELQPRGTKVEVIGLGCTPDAIDAVRDSLEETGFDKPRHRPPGDAGGSGLLEGDETPLPFGKVADTREWA